METWRPDSTIWERGGGNRHGSLLALDRLEMRTPTINLKAATLITSLLASTITITRAVATYWPRMFAKSGLRVVRERDPIGIQDPVAGALEIADGLRAKPKTEAEALSRASAWADLSASKHAG